MISVEEALEKILGEVSVLEAAPVPILESLGQVLAEDIVADINVPPLDNSAMDGYACRAADTAGASEKNPVTLRVIDTVMAGAISKQEVTAGTAIRIMTGAPVPRGADCVVQFENTDEIERRAAQAAKPPATVGVLEAARPGLNVRRAGEDLAKGAVALRRGTVIRPAEIGIMASLGHSGVRAVRRPVVAIISTGNELTPINDPLPEGKIHDSNAYAVAAQVKRCGAVPQMLGIARDDESEVTAKIKLAKDADLLLTTGGVSMGDYDVVKDILARDGDMVFWKVRVKPGKPLAFGKLKSVSDDGRTRIIPHLGLPGNAVSCMVSFELFARPAILKMMGKPHLARPSVMAVLEDDVTNDGGRRLYDRAIIERRNGRYYARLTGSQSSGILTSMSLANGLVLIPEDRKEVRKGETVRAIMLDWNEEVDVPPQD